MRKVGIYSTSGDKHTRLRNQMRRLFGCTVSLLYEDARGEATLNAPIARLTEFWWSERQPDARSLWESKIELGEDLFNEIIRCPIPIDLNTLRAMKRSPLGLDLYLWLTYRTFELTRPLRLTWPLLYKQFGVDPSRSNDKFTIRNFRTDCLRELKKVKDACRIRAHGVRFRSWSCHGMNSNITSFMLRITMIVKDLQLPSVGASSWRSGRGRRGG